MKPELEIILQSARTLAPAELPRLLGDLREVEAVALSRLAAPAHQPDAPDALLDVRHAAERLGVSPGYLYRHHDQFAFARRVGRKVLFSASGIDRFIRARR